MQLKLGRVAAFIDRFGIRQGIRLFLKIKNQRVQSIEVPNLSHNLHLRKGSSDIPIFEQVFVRGEYDIDLPFSPRVIFDAGANIGLFTVAMKIRFPSAAVYCIEPDAENISMLKKNVGQFKDVEILEAGLWPKQTRLAVIDTQNVGHSGLTVNEVDDGTVTGITVDSIMERFGINQIDLFKIDIEASEKELFSAGYESWLPKVEVIVIELHDQVKPGCAEKFFNAIQQYWGGFVYTIHGELTIVVKNARS